MDGNTIFWIIIVGIVILCVYVKLFLKKDVKAFEEKTLKYNYKSKQFYMTKSENDFYQRLVKLLGDKYYIFAQVPFTNFIDEKVPGQDFRAARAVINRKSVDYLICNKDYVNPLIAIELDDPSHERPDRIKRDELVNEIFRRAEMSLMHISNTNYLSDEDLVHEIKSAIANK